jgi:putative toxin-antitoxin system antitoxin component (TIGR02293 family)
MAVPDWRSEMTTASIHVAREPFGYAKLIGIKASDRLELSDKIQAGFPFSSFVVLTKSMEVTNRELAELVQISTRTLNRRQKEGKLKADESDRLLRFARIFTYAIDLFEGDKETAQSWLSSESKALKGDSPLEASKTEEGAREVENLIVRLEHGVFV